MGHLQKRRRRREPLVRLRAGRPRCVFPPPLDRLSSRKRLVVRRCIRVWRRCNRHVVPVLLRLAAQVRYPRRRTRTRICTCTRTRTGSSAIHAAAPAALERRVLHRRGRTRLGRNVVLMVLPIARPLFVLILLILPVLYLNRLIGRVIKRTDRIPVPSPVRLLRRRCTLALLAFSHEALLNHDEALLALPLVPLERARDGVEPVDALLVCTHSRQRVLGRGDLDVVALLELDAPAPVERGPRRRARVERYANTQLHRIRQQHRPEGQRMGADRRDENSWDFWVHERPAWRELVGC